MLTHVNYANQLTGFYIRATLAFNGLTREINCFFAWPGESREDKNENPVHFGNRENNKKIEFAYQGTCQ